jgi:IS5 family transposase
VSQPRDDRQDDLFGPRLEEIINLRHPLVRLAAEIDWQFLAGRFSSVCRVGPGQPPLPTRLMAGLLILKHMHNLSDEALCDRWVENPYFQYFCGEVVFQHAAPFDRSSLTRWRQRLGEEQIAALLQESLSVAHRAGAIETKDLERVVVDTTVQEKAVAHPTDARLTHRAIEKLVDLARREGVKLRQSYLRLAKRAAIMVGRYTHAHQFKRARRELKFLRTRLGRIIRDIRRQIDGDTALEDRFGPLLDLALRVRHQEQRQRGPKVYSLHAPEVECIGKGKARAPYELRSSNGRVSRSGDRRCSSKALAIPVKPSVISRSWVGCVSNSPDRGCCRGAGLVIGRLVKKSAIEAALEDRTTERALIRMPRRQAAPTRALS